MRRLSYLLLLFAILSLLFFILLVFLKKPFPLMPLASYQDAFDILTPLVLIPLYWLILHYSGREAPRLSETIAFLILAVFWVEGQGVHLAANSISNLMVLFARSGLVDVTGSDIFKLTYFYDEQLGHYLWHIGVLGLAALLIYREWCSPAGFQTVWWSTVLGGIIYGLTMFMITIEGQTVWMGLPFTLLVTLFGLIWGRKKLGQQPVLAFFFVACAVALLLYAGWGLYWSGFPEFSEAGPI
jgi:hypothetical protein